MSNFLDPTPPFFQLQIPPEGLNFCPQFPISNGTLDSSIQPLKRPRNSEIPTPQQNPRIHPPNPPVNTTVNKGPTNIFFKTRMCAKFTIGECRNGDHCRFAHGEHDIRRPPPNWQSLVTLRADEQSSLGNWEDDQSIIHRMKLCKKFYNGEECLYGNRCNFLHEDPSRFRNDNSVYNDSLVIRILPENRPQNNKDAFQGSGNVGLTNPKPNASYWKTRTCIKFETMGHCHYGETCHFAHGCAELLTPSGRAQIELGNVVHNSIKPLLTQNRIEMPFNNTVTEVPLKQEENGNKLLHKWKGSKKINCIYGDWIDDLPLAQNLSSKVES